MALLADMSQDDLDVVLKGIGEMMGDDPETIAAIQGILGDIVSTEDPVKSLSEILDREDFEKAITENLDWVNDSDWLKVYQKRHEILEAVIATGELPPEEALRFMEDPSAWETELKKVWDSLQAKTSEEL